MADARALGKPVVLVPHYGPVEKECDDGLRKLEHAGVKVMRGTFPAIDLLRNVMLSEAMHAGFDRFLFIDSDIGFKPEDALKLLGSAEPVVAAVYMKKGVKDFSGVFAKGITKVVFGRDAPGLYPMLYASGGFLRIRRDVLERMIAELGLPECHFGATKRIYPFFLPLAVPDGRGRMRYLTEDYSFSHRLHQIGVTPMADTTIKLTHFGRYGYTYEDLAPRPTFDNYTLDINYPEGDDPP
jgi:hypothetical protein